MAAWIHTPPSTFDCSEDYAEALKHCFINATQANANGRSILPRRDNKSIIARRKDAEHDAVSDRTSTLHSLNRTHVDTRGALATMEGDPHPRFHKCLHANTQKHVSMLRNTA